MKFFSVIIFLLCQFNGAFAQNASEVLSEKLSNMQSLQANFVQRIYDHEGEMLQQASGQLQVKRPRKLYWQTLEPYEHILVTNGKLIWLYDIDLEQISRQPFTADLDKAPALLLSGAIDEISIHYNVIKLHDVDGLQQFQLIPKSGTGVFNKLVIGFRNNVIARMILKDSFDQQTQIDFSQIKINVEIDDKLFEFVAPAGVDVLINEP